MLFAQPKFKMQYFDRKIIKSNWKRMNTTPLKRAGLHVRRIAKNSIRKVKKDRASTPPRPPYSHLDYGKGKPVPFHQIYSVSNVFGTSEVVGMVGYRSTGNIGQEPVPGLHEHGGMAPRFIRRRVKGRDKRGRFLKARFVGPPVRRMVRYPQRPFMHPAMMRSRQRMPRYWIGSFNRRAA